jgi:hypothetical protein
VTARVLSPNGCQHCGGPTRANVRDGCTPYTCTTPCTTCGHPGDDHRDWYRDMVSTGFCRRCPEGAGHDYTAPKEN